MTPIHDGSEDWVDVEGVAGWCGRGRPGGDSAASVAIRTCYRVPSMQASVVLYRQVPLAVQYL